MPPKSSQNKFPSMWSLVTLLPLRIIFATRYLIVKTLITKDVDPYPTLAYTMPAGFLFAFLLNILLPFSKLQAKHRRRLLLVADLFGLFGELIFVKDSRLEHPIAGAVIGFSTSVNGILTPAFTRDVIPKQKQRNTLIMIPFISLIAEGIRIFLDYSFMYGDSFYILKQISVALYLVRLVWLWTVEIPTDSQSKEKKEEAAKKNIESSLHQNEQSREGASEEEEKKSAKNVAAKRAVYIYSKQISISFLFIALLNLKIISNSMNLYEAVYLNMCLALTLITLPLCLFPSSFFWKDHESIGYSPIEALWNILDTGIRFSLPFYTVLEDSVSPQIIYFIAILAFLYLIGILTIQIPSSSPSTNTDFLIKRNQKRKLNQENPATTQEVPKLPANSYSLTPIGFIENSCYPDKFGVPRQPKLVPHALATLRLVPPFDHPESIRSLESWSHIWITFIFHESPDRWTPLIRPPRLGGNTKVGVFASRSTHRPNRLGLSLVEVIKIDTEKGVCLHLKGHDLIDKTPVVDIKPYIPWGDRADEARGGFALEPPVKLKVIFTPEAEKVLSERKDRDVLEPLIVEVMQQDPRPAYKSEEAERIFGVYLYDLDVRFRIKEENGEKVVRVHEIVKSHFAKET